MEVSKRDYDRVYEVLTGPMPEYLGHVFEDVCSEFLERSCRDVGTWWG